MNELPTAPTDAMLADFCAKANAGDAFLGDMLISSVIEHLKARRPLPAPVASHLAQALEECRRDPKNAARALGLYKRPKGRSLGKSVERDFHIAWAIYGFLEKEPECSLEQVFEHVGRAFHVSEGTAKRVWNASRSERRGATGRATDLLCEPPEVRTSRKVKIKK